MLSRLWIKRFIFRHFSFGSFKNDDYDFAIEFRTDEKIYVFGKTICSEWKFAVTTQV